MDGGLAAVLGALVGVLGTVGSAWLGYYASRTQIREQSVVEHAARLRGERREAYLSFVSATEQLDLVLRRFTPENCSTVEDMPRDDSGEIDWALIRDVSRALQEVQHAMFQAVARVDLSGPESVSKNSGCAWLHVLSLRDGMELIAERQEITQRKLDQLRVEIAGFHDKRHEFMHEAQVALQVFFWEKQG